MLKGCQQVCYIFVATVCARNTDEVALSGLASQAIQPASSLSLVSSGYGTSAGSEKSRWSHADVGYLTRTQLLTYLLAFSYAWHLSPVSVAIGWIKRGIKLTCSLYKACHSFRRSY